MIRRTVGIFPCVVAEIPTNGVRDTDPDKTPWPQYSSSGVREHTAELANLALSEVASIHSGTPPKVPSSSHSNVNLEYGFLDSSFSRANGRPFLPSRSTDVINEVSEPTTPDELASTVRRKSYLTYLFRNSPPETKPETKPVPSPSDECTNTDSIDSNPSRLSERSSLLPKTYPEVGQRRGYDAVPQGGGNVGSQHEFRPIPRINIKKVMTWPKEKGLNAVKVVFHRKTWNKRDIWEHGVVKTASYLPAVFLGLLLNILDGLSYGMAWLSTLLVKL